MIFLDETKINKFSSNMKVWCLTHGPKELSKLIVILTIKYGGGCVMIWRCMFINETGLISRIECSFNQCGYQKNLEEQLYNIIRKCDLDASKVIFQHDNATIYISKSMKQWFFRQPFEYLI